MTFCLGLPFLEVIQKHEINIQITRKDKKRLSFINPSHSEGERN